MKITTTFGSISRIEQQARDDFKTNNPNPYEEGTTAHRIWRLENERLAKQAGVPTDAEQANPVDDVEPESSAPTSV